MGVDYYGTLGLNKSATDSDIKKAYRKLAPQFHPQKAKNDFLAAKRFAQVCESYDVLSDQRKRVIYDHFGEEGLKSGVPLDTSPSGAWTEGYTYHGNDCKVFHDFFGGDNPFLEFFDKADGDMRMGFGGLYGRGAKNQDDSIVNDLPLTLEEMFYGCVLNQDGYTTSLREKILTINVKPGWRAGTTIKFEKEGDQSLNSIPADIIFRITEIPHERFSRLGDDLVLDKSITLSQALAGCVVGVTTLDDRTFNVPINNIIKNSFDKVVVGEGMPKMENSAKRGDLIVRLRVDFPDKLTATQKKALKAVLAK